MRCFFAPMIFRVGLLLITLSILSCGGGGGDDQSSTTNTNNTTFSVQLKGIEASRVIEGEKLPVVLDVSTVKSDTLTYHK